MDKDNIQADAEFDSNLERSELERIAVAEACGLSFTGKDDDGELEFVGNDQAWLKFYENDDYYREGATIPYHYRAKELVEEAQRLSAHTD